ncbi:hypothetical protein D3C84_745040 [compost metagenome]
MASTTATLTPVRMPGSSPMVQRMPAGAAISRSCRFMANTLIASSSALSRMRPMSSVSICSESLIFQVQLTTPCSHLSAGRPCRFSLR